MFVIDATGSMGDEIDRLRAGMQSMAKRINALDSDVDLRLGMVVFRDEGDTFVTATNTFTSDVAAFSSALDGVTADGGGDTPEAVDEALAAALDTPGWRPAGDAAQLVVLVGDAAGHADRTVAVPYTDSMRTAATRGMRVLPMASSTRTTLPRWCLVGFPPSSPVDASCSSATAQAARHSGVRATSPGPTTRSSASTT